MYRKAHPLSRSFSSPNGRVAGFDRMLRRVFITVNAALGPVDQRADHTETHPETPLHQSFPHRARDLRGA
jgi:hypothetical protein